MVPTISSPIDFPWYHIHRESLVPGIPDNATSLLTPVVIYWIVSLVFHLIDISGFEWLEQYRIQPSAEILKKNLATKSEVVATAAKMQILQTGFGFLWMHFFDGGEAFRNHRTELQEMSIAVAKWAIKLLGEEWATKILVQHGTQVTYYVYWWGVPLLQLVLAMFILDTYQYFAHRTLHSVPFLYKHLHSVHHRLYVPYAYGSQYNHPLEGIFVDGLSATLAATLAGLSERQSAVLFAIVTYKAVEDHCGYQFPWHPLRFLAGGGTEFHEIHHQIAGLKSNFSQPMFTFWDRVLGTYVTMEQLEAKKGGLRKVKEL